MVVLYIIGAGCSKNYDQGVSPVPDLQPPLNRDFFKMAKKIVDFYDLSHMHGPVDGLDHFIGELNRLYEYKDSKYDTTVLSDDRLNLEEVMTHFYLESEILDDSIPEVLSASKLRIETLNDLLAYTIAESLQGPVCRKHLRLAEKMQKGDIVWNFNYDLLLDNALYEKKKLTDSGYVMRVDYTFADGKWEKPKDSPSDVILLKLHGSRNWLKCGTYGSMLLLRGMKSVPALWTIVRDLPIETIKCPKCNSVKKMGLRRIIVPPSMVKSFGELQVRYLWKYAYSVSNIDRLIVIGFRFAEQDPEVEMLLRTMVQHNRISSDVPILIVNPRPKKVKKRFSSIFNRSNIAHESPNSFFESLT